MRIFYISFYLGKDEAEKRDLVVAAQKKIGYIAKCLRGIGDKLIMVSTALSPYLTGSLPQENIHISDQEEHVYLRAYGSKNKWLDMLRGRMMQVVLLRYLLDNVAEDDIVIFYHSLIYVWPVWVFKHLRKTKILMEFNDLYELHCTHPRMQKRIRAKENRMLQLADGFILASPYMKELIDEKKPSVTNYGSYDYFPQSKGAADPPLIIYTGIIESLRKAAFLVARAASLLPTHFRILVAGFGQREEVDTFMKLCAQANEKHGVEIIRYVGTLGGPSLDELMDKAHIALSCHTYAPEEIWKSKYSFPSKIPLNVGHGLRLVTYPYDIITNSPFDACSTYFNEFTPEALADAICRCVELLKDTDPDTMIGINRKLDVDFRRDLKELLLFHMYFQGAVKCDFTVFQYVLGVFLFMRKSRVFRMLLSSPPQWTKRISCEKRRILWRKHVPGTIPGFCAEQILQSVCLALTDALDPARRPSVGAYEDICVTDKVVNIMQRLTPAVNRPEGFEAEEVA